MPITLVSCLCRGRSLRFDNFYVSPQCAQSRAALLTGRSSPRVGENQQASNSSTGCTHAYGQLAQLSQLHHSVAADAADVSLQLLIACRLVTASARPAACVQACGLWISIDQTKCTCQSCIICCWHGPAVTAACSMVCTAMASVVTFVAACAVRHARRHHARAWR
jgi:hypothetical protein